MTKKRVRDTVICLLILSLLLSLLKLNSMQVLPVSGKEEVIIPGVIFNSYELGNLNYTGFSGIIAASGASLAQQAVSLQVSGADHDIVSTYRDIGIFPDSERIWQEAVAVGNTGGWWAKLWTRWQVRRKGYEVPLYLHVNKEQAEKTLKKLSEPWYSEPKDAKIAVSDAGRISIIDDVWGTDVDITAVMADLENKISATPGEPLSLHLSIVNIRPKQTKSDVEAYHITGLVSRFSTNFNAQRLNRTKNITLAAKSLDNYMLAPGEVFSFNQVVGPRVKERGYDEADIIMQNELVPGIGGGVCQVSSTLYNAALLAGLEVVERYNHSMMIAYVRPGLDATVAYDSKDLKFRNTSGGHLIIKCAITQSTLSVKIYGWAKQKGRIAFKSEIEREIAPKTIYREDPSVPKGNFILEHQGEPGYIVKVERYYYDEKGKLLRTDLLYRDYYPPVDRVIKALSGEALLPSEPSLLSNMDNL